MVTPTTHESRCRYCSGTGSPRRSSSRPVSSTAGACGTTRSSKPCDARGRRARPSPLARAFPGSRLPSRRRAMQAVIDAIKHLDPLEREQLIDAAPRALRRPLPDDLMMTSGQVRALNQAGMFIGGHTQTHPVLTAVDAARRTRDRRWARTLRDRGRTDPFLRLPEWTTGPGLRPPHVDIVRRLGSRPPSRRRSASRITQRSPNSRAWRHGAPALAPDGAIAEGVREPQTPCA